MKSTDLELRSLLRRADPACREDYRGVGEADDFAAAVHQRIRVASRAEGSAGGPAMGWRRELRPMAAVAAVIAALLAGGSAAYARHQRLIIERQADAFVRSIDPVLMHADQGGR